MAVSLDQIACSIPRMFGLISHWYAKWNSITQKSRWRKRVSWGELVLCNYLFYRQRKERKHTHHFLLIRYTLQWRWLPEMGLMSRSEEFDVLLTERLFAVDTANFRWWRPKRSRGILWDDDSISTLWIWRTRVSLNRNETFWNSYSYLDAFYRQLTRTSLLIVGEQLWWNQRNIAVDPGGGRSCTHKCHFWYR